MTEAAGGIISVRRPSLPSISPASVAKAVVSVCLVLAIAGVAIAAYLAIENLQSRSGVCTITHGCQTVQQSRYGKLFGIPISVPGLGLYLLLGAGALAADRLPGATTLGRIPGVQRRTLWLRLLALPDIHRGMGA